MHVQVFKVHTKCLLMLGTKGEVKKWQKGCESGVMYDQLSMQKICICNILSTVCQLIQYLVQLFWLALLLSTHHSIGLFKYISYFWQS